MVTTPISGVWLRAAAAKEELEGIDDLRLHLARGGDADDGGDNGLDEPGGFLVNGGQRRGLAHVELPDRGRSEAHRSPPPLVPAGNGQQAKRDKEDKEKEPFHSRKVGAMY